MNIVLASDNNFVQHCAVTMISIMEHNSEVVFYLLTEKLKNDNVNVLRRLVESRGSTLHIVEVPSQVVEQFPMPKGVSTHISIATYYRLFVCDLIPESIDKIIYLDCDVIVRKSLDKLWNTNIENFALGAVYQYNDWCDSNDTWDRLNIPNGFGYFNAGVLLINLRYWRLNSVQKQLFDYISINYDLIRSHDQDVLNAVLYKKTYPLSYQWNLLSFFFDDYTNWNFPYPHLLNDITRIIKDPHIVHFVNKPKPWQCGCTNPFRREYYKYLSLTPWKEFKPHFEASKWFFNYLWHPLMVQLGIVKRRIIQLSL